MPNGLRTLSAKDQGELDFWIDHIHGVGCLRESGREFADFWTEGAQRRLAYYFSVLPQPATTDAMWVDVGTGPYSVLFQAPSGVTKVMVDPLMKHYFHHALVPDGYRSSRHVFLEGVCERLPLSDESADMVFCTNALDHVDDPWQALAELARILKVGGDLVLETDTGGQTDHMHPHAFSIEDLESHAAELRLSRTLGQGGIREKRRPGAQLYYGFFKKTADTRTLFPAAAPPARGALSVQLVLEGVRGFNILRQRERVGADRFYAIRQVDGAFNYHRFVNGLYPSSVEGLSLDEVVARIQALEP
jgi:SAM-dependent methyltransferase